MRPKPICRPPVPDDFKKRTGCGQPPHHGLARSGRARNDTGAVALQPQSIAQNGEPEWQPRYPGSGQPNEVAPAFLFLACEDTSHMSGQILHPNGGTIVNG